MGAIYVSVTSIYIYLYAARRDRSGFGRVEVLGPAATQGPCNDTLPATSPLFRHHTPHLHTTYNEEARTLNGYAVWDQAPMFSDDKAPT